MKKINILLVVSFLFTLLACNKNEVVEKIDFEIDKEITLTNPSNSSNPYDYCGVLHNKSLRMTLDELSGEPNVNFEKTISTAFRISGQVVLEAGIVPQNSSPINFEDYENYEDLMALLQFLMEDVENNYENFIAALDLDSDTKEQLQSLFENVIAMAEDENVTEDDIFNEILIFETQVLENILIIPSDEIETILVGTSTFRHSLSFWADEMNIQSFDKKAPNTEVNELAKKKWWKWIGVALADVGGALAGTATGGPILGVVVGAVASAAGAATETS